MPLIRYSFALLYKNLCYVESQFLSKHFSRLNYSKNSWGIVETRFPRTEPKMKKMPRPRFAGDANFVSEPNRDSRLGSAQSCIGRFGTILAWHLTRISSFFVFLVDIPRFIILSSVRHTYPACYRQKRKTWYNKRKTWLSKRKAWLGTDVLP